MTQDSTTAPAALAMSPMDGALVEVETHTSDGQTYDATATHVIEVPADVTAAGLRQALRQQADCPHPAFRAKNALNCI